MSVTVSGYVFSDPVFKTTDLEHRQGIYLIVDCRQDGSMHCLDVGESGDVRTRIEQHDRKACWRRHALGDIGVSVSYTPGYTTAERQKIEGYIRAAMNPPCGER